MLFDIDVSARHPCQGSRHGFYAICFTVVPANFLEDDFWSFKFSSEWTDILNSINILGKL